MTIDYHRTPMIQFRPDAELYAAIEAHQRPGESINQTAKRLVQEAISARDPRRDTRGIQQMEAIQEAVDGTYGKYMRQKR